MQNNSSSYSTIETTTGANAPKNADNAREMQRPTLAELLKVRAEERLQQEIARAQQQRQQREQDCREALDHVATWMHAHVSDDLRAALCITYAVDESRLDNEDGSDYHDDYAFTRAGYAMLDLTGAGVDDSDAALLDPNRDERWRISREYFSYDYQWAINGPSAYRVSLDNGYANVRNLDAEILDALAAYPAWLIGEAEKRADAEQERIATHYADERARNV